MFVANPTAFTVTSDATVAVAHTNLPVVAPVTDLAITTVLPAAVAPIPIVLEAVSVVKAPVFAAVLPIAGGDDK